MDVYTRTVERESPLVDVSKEYPDQVSVHYADGGIHLVMTTGEARDLARSILAALPAGASLPADEDEEPAPLASLG